MSTHTINLAPDLETFLKTQVTSGVFKDENAVIDEAMRLMKMASQKRAFAWHHKPSPSRTFTPMVALNRNPSMPAADTWHRSHHSSHALKVSRFFAVNRA